MLFASFQSNRFFANFGNGDLARWVRIDDPIRNANERATITFAVVNALSPLVKPLGIEKGKEFKPDVRMKTILTEAAAVGNALKPIADFSLISLRPRTDKQKENLIKHGNHTAAA